MTERFHRDSILHLHPVNIQHIILSASLLFSILCLAGCVCQTHKRFKIMLFIRAKHNMNLLRVWILFQKTSSHFVLYFCGLTGWLTGAAEGCGHAQACGLTVGASVAGHRGVGAFWTVEARLALPSLWHSRCGGRGVAAAVPACNAANSVVSAPLGGIFKTLYKATVTHLESHGTRTQWVSLKVENRLHKSDQQQL